MTRGYVTFSNAPYEPLTAVLARGLHRFSRYPLLYLPVGFDSTLTASNLTLQRIEHPSFPKMGMHAVKFLAALLSPFDITAVIDSDTVPNLNIDELLDLAALECVSLSYPLCTMHCSNPQNQGQQMDFFGIKAQTMPYVHACAFAFGPRARPFFQECLAMQSLVAVSPIHEQNHDETILNINLWRHGVTRSFNTFTPWAGAFETYASGSFPYAPSCYSKRNLSFHLFHSEKDPAKAATMLEHLSAQSAYDFYANPIRSNQLVVESTPMARERR